MKSAIRFICKPKAVSCFLAGIATAFQCSAQTVDVSRVTGYWTIPGGEFNIANANPSNPANTAVFDNELSYFSASTIVSGPYGPGFETFCNSGTNDLLNNPETGTFSLGGVTWGTAWLFSQFAAGTLAGYDYTVTGSGGTSFANRAAAAYALQNAIWELDGTGGGNLNPTAPGISIFLTEAENAAAGFGLSVSNAANGAFGVGEFYLTYNGAISQPMLVISSATGTLPGVVTGAASGITTTSAVLKGSVNPNDVPTTGYFEWGTTTNYGNNSAD
jgi:hypothetical protein